MDKMTVGPKGKRNRASRVVQEMKENKQKGKGQVDQLYVHGCARVCVCARVRVKEKK